MANFLFWNVNRKPLSEHLVRLCRQRDIDILLVAEWSDSYELLLRDLNEGEDRMYFYVAQDATRVLCFSRYPRDSCRMVLDKGGISVRHLRPPLGADIILVAVHLPSKMYYGPDDQSACCSVLADTVAMVEREFGHRRTVVTGDFNMSPFENGIVNARGLNAIMDRRVVKKGPRTIHGESYPYFYNPMWSLMGDRSSGAPGTYFYPESGYLRYYWHTFDQVLVRDELLKYFDIESVSVVLEAGEIRLLDKDGFPDSVTLSDHLPLFFKLELEKAL